MKGLWWKLGTVSATRPISDSHGRPGVIGRDLTQATVRGGQSQKRRLPAPGAERHAA